MAAPPRSQTPAVRRTAHAIVEIPLAGRHGVALPMLLLGDGDAAEASVFATAYLRNAQFVGTDPTTLHKSARAIGLLHDYYVLKLAAPVLDTRGLQLLIKQFFEARRNGCTELGWQPVALKTALDDVRYVSNFSLFCATNFGHLPANPLEKILITSLSGEDFQNWLARGKARGRSDPLFHIFGATAEGQGKVTRWQFRPEQGKDDRSTTAKHFPPDSVLEFIAQTPSLRDRLCWMLMFFGGLRISELMHIYTRDITLDPSEGTAKVTLANPRDGALDWIDANQKKHRGTRAAFLMERYGRIPRNLLSTGHPDRAGWKGMLLEDTRRKESRVYWTDDRVGQLFWKTHLEYMRTERLRVSDTHPYYFVSLRQDAFGEPLKLSNLHKQFYRSAERCGLTSSTDGVNPHGARHFYGYYCASVLRLKVEKVQRMLHHTSPLSTQVYYRLEDWAIKEELAKAQERLKQNLPTFLEDKRLLLSTGECVD